MKPYPIILCALLALTGVQARAAEVDTTRFATTSAAPPAARAQVRDETRRALAAHEILFGDVVQVPAAVAAGRSRQEVRDETLMALMERTRAGERGLYAN